MLNVTNTDDDGAEVRRSGYMRRADSGNDRSAYIEGLNLMKLKDLQQTDNRQRDKEIALKLTELYCNIYSMETYVLERCRFEIRPPIDVFKQYWRELATMV